MKKFLPSKAGFNFIWLIGLVLTEFVVLFISGNAINAVFGPFTALNYSLLTVIVLSVLIELFFHRMMLSRVYPHEKRGYYTATIASIWLFSLLLFFGLLFLIFLLTSSGR